MKEAKTFFNWLLLLKKLYYNIIIVFKFDLFKGFV